MTEDEFTWGTTIRRLIGTSKILMPKAQAAINLILEEAIKTHGSRKENLPDLDFLDDSNVILQGKDKDGKIIERGGTWTVKDLPKAGEPIHLTVGWVVENSVNVILTVKPATTKYTIRSKTAKNVESLILPCSTSIEIGVLEEPLVKIQCPAHTAYNGDIKFGLRSEVVEELMRCLSIAESEKGLA